MDGQIFINYRREDSAYAAGRLFDRLSQHFGADNIFMDIDAIELGIDFVQKIREAVSGCDVMVAVIGQKWLNAADAGGRRRLDNPNDFVRIELEAALERDIRVIPALVDSATMPIEEDLPEALGPLARRNGLIIGHTRFDSDVDRLIRGLEAIIKVVTEHEDPEAKRLEDEKAGAKRIDEGKNEVERRATIKAEAVHIDAEQHLASQPKKKLWSRLPIWGWIMGISMTILVIVGLWVIQDQLLEIMVSDTLTPTITPLRLKTLTPTATMDADPTVYDNFNNPGYDDSINETLWHFYEDNGTGQIHQKDGMLVLSRDEIPSGSIEDHSGIGLHIRKYTGIVLDSPIFLESKMRVDSYQEGNVGLCVSFFPDSGSHYGTVCVLGYGDQEANLGCTFFDESGETAYETRLISSSYGTWHTARIEIDPATMEVTYNIAGQEVGSYVPINADELKNAEMHTSVCIGSFDDESVTGYIDDVRIGQIEQ